MTLSAVTQSTAITLVASRNTQKCLRLLKKTKQFDNVVFKTKQINLLCCLWQQHQKPNKHIPCYGHSSHVSDLQNVVNIQRLDLVQAEQSGFPPSPKYLPAFTYTICVFQITFWGCHSVMWKLEVPIGILFRSDSERRENEALCKIESTFVSQWRRPDSQFIQS